MKLIKRFFNWCRNLFKKKSAGQVLRPITPANILPAPRPSAKQKPHYHFKVRFNRPQLIGKVYNHKKQYYRIVDVDGGRYCIRFI